MDLWTAMHFDAEIGAVEVIELLIEALGNVSKQDSEGSTAMHFAVGNGHLEVLSSLVLAQCLVGMMVVWMSLVLWTVAVQQLPCFVRLN